MNRDNIRTIAKSIALWIPVLLLAIIFVPQGWAKFSNTSGWARAFAHWGYPAWFRVTIGVVELAAIPLLLSRRTAVLGAALIICVMLGGMATHLLKDNGRHMTSEVVPLTLAVVVLISRRRESRLLA